MVVNIGQHFERTLPECSVGEIGPERVSQKKSMSGSIVPDIWKDNSDLIYQYLARQSDYQQLCVEVAYVLRQKLQEELIEFSSISYRTKDLQSFLEKIQRKKYNDPFKDITDLAGVRVVCLYPSDLARIEKLITREFDLIEKVDKYKENSSDLFGYMAVHFLVKLGEEFSGARYDNLKNLVCEIQTRTVLQHAWALLDQHLVYKTKSSVPEELRRRINDLSKVLEDADRQFERIRQERATYIRALQMSKSDDAFWEQEVNLDSFRVFCERAFPEAPRDEDVHTFNRIIKWLDSTHYSNIGKLRETVEKARPKLDKVVREMDSRLKEKGSPIEQWTDLYLVHASLAIADKNYRETAGTSSEFREILERLDKEE